MAPRYWAEGNSSEFRYADGSWESISYPSVFWALCCLSSHSDRIFVEPGRSLGVFGLLAIYLRSGTEGVEKIRERVVASLAHLSRKFIAYLNLNDCEQIDLEYIVAE
jgi:hypothetical protein